MSIEVRKLPPFRFWIHFQAAFGGAFGTINLVVGAISIFRLIVRAFDWGLSPILKSIFAAYVQVFHGAIDFVAEMLTRFSGIEVHVPAWAHDWIILWLVGTGAAFRIIQFTAKVWGDNNLGHASYPRGALMKRLAGGLIMPYRRGSTLRIALTVIATYLQTVILWLFILLEIHLVPPGVEQGVQNLETRISYVAIFWLQTAAIILAIFGLSALNAQTM